MELRWLIATALVLLPSLIWWLLKQVHSPWWLENIGATPLVIVPISLLLTLLFVSYISFVHGVLFVLINLCLAIALNLLPWQNNKVCSETVRFFQFNIKYQEERKALAVLIEHLVAQRYHLIALQGVSAQARSILINELSSVYPYFIRGSSEKQQIVSDQLLFSRYRFSNVNYKSQSNSAFLVSSIWHLPVTDISLQTLHPPSPRNEVLWQKRNQTLYQLKHLLVNATQDVSLVIGDLNLSQHSKRIVQLTKGMETNFIASWPQHPWLLADMGIAIDHLWVSKPVSICHKSRMQQFLWSDHYAIQTDVDFSKLKH